MFWENGCLEIEREKRHPYVMDWNELKGFP